MTSDAAPDPNVTGIAPTVPSEGAFVSFHRRLRRGTLTAALAALTCAVLAPGAAASPSMLISIADDGTLAGVHGDPAPIVQRWKQSGVQNVRIFAQWSLMAPEPTDTRAPKDFDATAPGAYDFRNLDRRVDLVRKNGMSVTLTVTGPGPVWGSLEPARRNQRWRPSPTKFGRFAAAVAQHYADRVDRYIVWNEPNVATWLQPQLECTGDDCRAYAPHLYRKLAAKAYSAIRKADPDAEIAIGATSSKGDKYRVRTNGTTQPLTFLREMACVNKHYKRIKHGECRHFKRPRGNVLAYHPHSSKHSPGYTSPSHSDARMGDLSRVTTVIDKLTRKKRIKVVGHKKMPLWLSEYAYETDPPDERLGISLAKQSAWSQWGWWIAFRNSRVKMLAQYEWIDEAVGADDPFAHGWQSGLYDADGKAKPLAQAFPNPIFGYRTSKHASVWGHVRTATGTMDVQLQRRKDGEWRSYKTVRTSSRGSFTVRVPRSAHAEYRYQYVSPVDGETMTSTATRLRKR